MQNMYSVVTNKGVIYVTKRDNAFPLYFKEGLYFYLGETKGPFAYELICVKLKNDKDLCSKVIKKIT
jgi:hypothetical protein